MQTWKAILIEYHDSFSDQNTNNSFKNRLEKEINLSSEGVMGTLYYLSNEINNGVEQLKLLRLVIKSCEVMGTWDVNALYNEIELTEIFRMIEGDCPSEHTIVITLGHGSATGIFKRIRRQEDFPVQLVSTKILGNAILNGCGKKASILFMNNCFMQHIHSWLDLHLSAEILIAPQGPIRETSFLVKTLMSLFGTATFQKDQFATSICHFPPDRTADPLDPVNRFQISAVDLTSFDALYFQFVLFVKALKCLVNAHPAVVPEIRLMRAKLFCFDYPLEYELVDLLNFTTAIKKITGIQEEFFLAIARNLNQSYRHFLLHQCYGEQVYHEMPSCFENIYGICPSGFGIHFPYMRGKRKENQKRGCEFRSEFVELSGWNDFLEVLFKPNDDAQRV